MSELLLQEQIVCVYGLVVLVMEKIFIRCARGLNNYENHRTNGAYYRAFIFKLVLWAVLAGLIYHCVAGIKHLIMDLGYGETMEGGIAGAKAVFAVSGLLIVLVGAWIW